EQIFMMDLPWKVACPTEKANEPREEGKQARSQRMGSSKPRPYRLVREGLSEKSFQTARTSQRLHCKPALALSRSDSASEGASRRLYPEALKERLSSDRSSRSRGPPASLPGRGRSRRAERPAPAPRGRRRRGRES